MAGAAAAPQRFPWCRASGDAEGPFQLQHKFSIFESEKESA
jgi:hypothetical protein